LAQNYYRDALRIDEARLGPVHAKVALDLNNLAALALMRRQYKAAEPLFARTVALAEKVYPGDNPEKGSAFINCAEFYRLQKRYQEAAEMYGRGIAILEKAWGRDDPRLAGMLDRLAGVLRIQQQYATAAKLETRASTIRVRQALRGE
jgi:tetratricopeptide (TPR) repeat protein